MARAVAWAAEPLLEVPASLFRASLEARQVFPLRTGSPWPCRVSSSAPYQADSVRSAGCASRYSLGSESRPDQESPAGSPRELEPVFLRRLSENFDRRTGLQYSATAFSLWGRWRRFREDCLR